MKKCLLLVSAIFIATSLFVFQETGAQGRKDASSGAKSSGWFSQIIPKAWMREKKPPSDLSCCQKLHAKTKEKLTEYYGLSTGDEETVSYWKRSNVILRDSLRTDESGFLYKTFANIIKDDGLKLSSDLCEVVNLIYKDFDDDEIDFSASLIVLEDWVKVDAFGIKKVGTSPINPLLIYYYRMIYGLIAGQEDIQSKISHGVPSGGGGPILPQDSSAGCVNGKLKSKDKGPEGGGVTDPPEGKAAFGIVAGGSHGDPGGIGPKDPTQEQWIKEHGKGPGGAGYDWYLDCMGLKFGGGVVSKGPPKATDYAWNTWYRHSYFDENNNWDVTTEVATEFLPYADSLVTQEKSGFLGIGGGSEITYLEGEIDKTTTISYSGPDAPPEHVITDTTQFSGTPEQNKKNYEQAKQAADSHSHDSDSSGGSGESGGSASPASLPGPEQGDGAKCSGMDYEGVLDAVAACYGLTSLDDLDCLSGYEKFNSKLKSACDCKAAQWRHSALDPVATPSGEPGSSTVPPGGPGSSTVPLACVDLPKGAVPVILNEYITDPPELMGQAKLPAKGLDQKKAPGLKLKGIKKDVGSGKKGTFQHEMMMSPRSAK